MGNYPSRGPPRGKEPPLIGATPRLAGPRCRATPRPALLRSSVKCDACSSRASSIVTDVSPSTVKHTPMPAIRGCFSRLFIAFVINFKIIMNARCVVIIATRYCKFCSSVTAAPVHDFPRKSIIYFIASLIVDVLLSHIEHLFYHWILFSFARRRI